MISYNSDEPLISIHIPKCGGTSFKEGLKQWFGRNLYLHKFDEISKKKPKKYRLTKLFSYKQKSTICIHGHFNKEREFGVRDYYPNVNQFITFLRDPLEIQLSVYNFNHKLSKSGIAHNGGKLTNDIDEYLETSEPFIKNYIPDTIDYLNFKPYFEDNFIHIGIIEEYQKSLNILSEKLGMKKLEIGHLNETERVVSPSNSSIILFKNKCKFEYELYEYAKNMNN